MKYVHYMSCICLIVQSVFYRGTSYHGATEIKNLKRFVSYYHSNPNNARKSTCKNIEVDIDILLGEEAYIALDLWTTLVSIVHKSWSDDTYYGYKNSHATRSILDSLCTLKSSPLFLMVTCPNSCLHASVTSFSFHCPFLYFTRYKIFLQDINYKNDFTWLMRCKALLKL